ncbi:hypothetical protein ASD04_13190 [Devosia sp. Root436]|uniref:hypothetical protein n=1 Tax=Devosia sp. Root436 TaxID=1736537 RepID=UPI0006F8C271|nr:hypothetical protein [Devosia sp. Root436]KQX35725.1 hypothetical protein ASD04_13190 [Devosia sp. Root436]
MTETATVASIPAAWLRPLPQGHKIPFWRWIVLPATTLMLKRNGGVWMSGTLTLAEGNLQFTQTRLTKSRNPPASWTIPLAEIADIGVEKRMASERIDIAHASGPIKLMSVRSEDFVAQLRQALPSS